MCNVMCFDVSFLCTFILPYTSRLNELFGPGQMLINYHFSKNKTRVKRGKILLTHIWFIKIRLILMIPEIDLVVVGVEGTNYCCISYPITSSSNNPFE